MLKIAIILFSFTLPIFGQATKTKPVKKKWPSRFVGKPIYKMESSKKDGKFLYESTYFTFSSDVEIPEKTILKFASNADSVPSILSRLPLNLMSLPKQADDSKPVIHIFTDEDAFIRVGGSKQAAGLYSSRHKSVYLRHESFIKDERPNYTLLTHELTHLCMHGVMQNTRPWFNEGNAEYFSIALESNRRYNFSNIAGQIPKDTKRYLSPDTKVFQLPSLKTLLSRDNHEWRRVNKTLPIEERYIPYQASVILIHYFYHLDKKGKDKVAAYLEKSAEEKHPDEAQKELFPKGIDVELPIIEKGLEKYWAKKGLKIKFGDQASQ